MSIWLIGAGEIAQEYARIMEKLDLSFHTIGRGKDSAASFEKTTGQAVRTGGLKSALEVNKAPEKAIIAVGIEQLAKCAINLIRAGTKEILVEKPGGINLAEVEELNNFAQKDGASVKIAYNRRFYGSVLQAQQLILEDDGVLSVKFEFTEWSHVIAPLVKGEGVKEHWLLGNSTHVIDLVFHIIGRPIDWKCWHTGSLDWHPAAARFVGAGMSEKGIMFSYLADWQAPGRWGIEILTAKHRLILSPLETLQIIKLGKVTSEVIDSTDNFDQDFKPGFYRQTKAFLEDDSDLFCTISEQVENVRIYSEVAGYL